MPRARGTSSGHSATHPTAQHLPSKPRATRMQRAAAEKISRRRKKRIMPWQRPNMSRAERVIAFLEFLPITKGILIGTKLSLLPNQRRFIERVYTDTGDVRLAIHSEPRGNGKTGLVAGLALCHLVGPEAEPRGECYSAAVNRLQSALMFEEMAAIVAAVPDLSAQIWIRRGGQRRCMQVVSGPGVDSRYEALSADSKSSHGLAPSWWAYDELAQTNDRRLFDALVTASGKRKRTLGIVLSTQADDDEHPLSQLIDDGLAETDPSVVVDLLCAPADADVFDEQILRACNPALGIFLDEKTVFAEQRQARRLPSAESAFRNLRCNQRLAAAADLLCPPSVWALGNEPVNESIFTDGRAVFGGLDLSARLDLTAFVMAAEDDAGRIHFKPMAWTPEKTLALRTQRDGAPYDVWHRQGLLRATPGLAIDYAYVLADLLRFVEGVNLVSVAYDAWNINALKQQLDKMGGTLPLVPFVQGWKSFSPAVAAFEVAAAESRIVHGGHPVLRWCVANTTLVHAAGAPEKNRKPEKRRLYGRIDLAVAALMAVGGLKVSGVTPVELSALIA